MSRDQIDTIKEQLRPVIESIGQAKLARQTGIAQPSISAWLAGNRGMPLDRIATLADACGFALRIRLTKKKT